MHNSHRKSCQQLYCGMPHSDCSWNNRKDIRGWEMLVLKILIKIIWSVVQMSLSGFNINTPQFWRTKLPALEAATTSEMVRTKLNALHAVKKSFIETESSEKIRRALRSNIFSNSVITFFWNKSFPQNTKWSMYIARIPIKLSIVSCQRNRVLSYTLTISFRLVDLWVILQYHESSASFNPLMHLFNFHTCVSGYMSDSSQMFHINRYIRL